MSTGDLQKFLQAVEPDPNPVYIEAGAEADGDLRRMTAVRQLEDGTVERAKHVFQLSKQGARNLMVALYGDEQVFMAEERFRALSQGPPVAELAREVSEWRAKFAMLSITIDEPDDEFVLAYIAYATVYADTFVGTEPFPYGPDPIQWPDAVKAWMLAFTKGLVRYLIVPPQPHAPLKD